MARLKVLQQFRDADNFFSIHEVGDIITVLDEQRVASLVGGGICQPADTEQKEKVEEKPQITAQAVEQTPQEEVNEEVKEEVKEETPSLPKKERQYRRRKQ